MNKGPRGIEPHQPPPKPGENVEPTQPQLRVGFSLKRHMKLEEITYLETCRRIDRRTQHLLTVLMIDVDEFKAYNDHVGHTKRDLCLHRWPCAAGCGAVQYQSGDPIKTASPRLGGC